MARIGPLDVERQSRRFVCRTTVDRLLAWGREPFASNAKNATLLADKLDDLRSDRRRQWYGMRGRDVLALRSWPEGLALAERYRRELPELPPLPSVARVPTWAEDGDEFDRDRFDAGQDECWRTRRRQRRPGKPVLTLTCEVGGACKLAAADLAWSGAVAAAVCDAAELAGYRLEIQAAHGTRAAFTSAGQPRDAVQVVAVKDAADPLDLETVVMALACPAFFRWYVMRSLLAVSPAADVADNFGFTEPVTAEFRGDLHIGHCHSAGAARDEVRRLVAHLAGMAETAAA